MRTKLKISLYAIVASILFFTSCKEEKICAAYNSAFVYDATNNGYYFTSFGGPDSMPTASQSKRFNEFGMVNKDGKRHDKSLNNIDTKDLRKITASPDSSLMDDFNDSLGSILSVKELFPERLNTDQEAYDHYIGELMEKYRKEHPQPKPTKVEEVKEEFDSSEKLTSEQKKQLKKEKKEEKARAKEEKRKAKEEPEEVEEEFDLDL